MIVAEDRRLLKAEVPAWRGGWFCGYRTAFSREMRQAFHTTDKSLVSCYKC